MDRNLIKRRLKAILAPYKETLQGCKLTIGIKKEIKQAKFKELKEDLQGLLAKKP
ncbi:MAG: ribonuclease P protein component [Candidatus Pacebacteria bacterium]|nr:ribonuclease P protein component [Candidatus Paceibacterota bacterium]